MGNLGLLQGYESNLGIDLRLLFMGDVPLSYSFEQSLGNLWSTQTSGTSSPVQSDPVNPALVSFRASPCILAFSTVQSLPSPFCVLAAAHARRPLLSILFCQSAQEVECTTKCVWTTFSDECCNMLDGWGFSVSQVDQLSARITTRIIVSLLSARITTRIITNFLPVSLPVSLFLSCSKLLLQLLLPPPAATAYSTFDSLSCRRSTLISFRLSMSLSNGSSTPSLS